MEVKLLTHYPIEILGMAARTSHNSQGGDDMKLLKKLLKWGHLSVFEHYHATWLIKGCSLICMAQLTRHRTFNFTIKSKRFTLKKSLENGDFHLKSLSPFLDKRVFEYVSWISSLNLSNDELEYLVPGSFETDIVMTADLRNLMNFFKLRLNKDAHFEIKELANHLLDSLPLDVRSLVVEYLNSISLGN